MARHRVKRIIQSAAATGALAFGGLAAAQTAPVAVAAAPEAGDGEIVVTAQRRSENLQNVPVAISVVRGAALGTVNINSAETLQQVVPSLTFKRGTTNSNATLAIRGIGTQSFSSGAEPSVSTVVDGVVLGRSGQAFQEFADIDRIEVLRGPQGTLFGKNASAGALNIVTRAPSATFAADGSVGYFDKNEYRVAANVNAPLGEGLAARLSGVFGKYDGNIHNAFNNSTINGYERYGFRAKLLGESGIFKITLAGDYVHAKDNCCGDVLGTFIPNAQQLALFLPQQLPVVPAYGNRSLNQNFIAGTIDTNAGVAATIDVRLGDHTLTSISAYRKWKNRQLRDGDFGSTAGDHVASMNIDVRDDGRLDFDQYSQELRIASPTGNTLEYVAGLFIWETSEDDDFTRTDFRCTASTLAVDATGFAPCRPGVSTFQTTTGIAHWNTKFHSQAGFGQATLNLTDTVKLFAGARYTHDIVEYNYARVTTPAIPIGVAGSFAGAERASDNGISGRAGIQWQATPDVLAYGSYARGYKGPALNVFFSVGAANKGAIGSETSNAFEAGLKTRLIDRTLTFNAAVYNQVLDNFQANSFVTGPLGVIVSLTNAGRVRSRGFEMDFAWRPTDGLTFNGGYTYNEATIRAFSCAPTLTPAQLATCLAHNGKPLPFAPKNKFNVSGDWRLPFSASLPVNVNVNSLVSFSSRINFDLDQTPLAQQAQYATVDAAIVIASKDDKYQLSLIGKNLTDKYYTTFVTPSGNGVAAGSYARLQVPRDAERYFGVRLAAKY